MRARASRTREEILATATIVDGVVWATCHHCGGSGNYPSSLIPAGRCRFYCWRGRTAETFGKLPYQNVDKYVRNQQARDRREARAAAKWEAERQQRAAAERDRTARAGSPDPRLADALAAFGHTVSEAWLAPLDNRGGLQDVDGTLLDMTYRWVRAGTLTEAQWGLVASIVARKRERESLRENSQWVGEIGQRVDVTATVEITKHMEGRWGTTTLLKVRDEAGNALTWFASGFLGWGRGDRIQLRGTVKAHDTYNGERQTRLTRCTAQNAALAKATGAGT